ncbi:hypothetical protein CQ047_16055 [Microbacterium sp. MYb72]|uniref:tyrosine-type recombinase/integrase n=1 Tax=Microbacterium sp. MYb72 TaxID=1848693 RepID=UPI000CFC6A3F|nr:tyrosine-type recombinase/integrase [Microbacterium sp. MYb72]PRB04971.1 hypothetical protein CQ047_16055 [Microbacterium sp. MYb72]
MSARVLPRSGNVCQSCGVDRGKRSSGWAAFTGTDRDTGAERIAHTCPECPERSEPIRRIESRGVARFRVVLDTSAKGQARQQVTRTCDTLAEARAFVETTREHVRRGTFSRDDVRTLCERWLSTLTDMREVTQQGYRSALRPVLARLGDRSVADVRVRDVDEWIAWARREGGMRGQPLSPRSVRYGLAAAALAFDRAVRDEVIASNPWRKVKPPKSAPKVTGDAHYWTRDQVAAFRAASDADALAGVWRLSLAGMTRADVHGLQWDDVDMDRGTVRVERGRVALQSGGWAVEAPKSEQRKRTLPVERVEPGTMALLRSLRAAQAADRLRAGAAWEDTGYVIVDALGRPEQPERYSERFRRLASRAGLPSIRLHALRHSLAHYLDSIGVPPSASAAWLGHTLAVFLDTYFPERGAMGVEQAAEAMERAIAV